MHTLANVSKKVQRGFTLLELLIVIAILAILAAVVIIVLNPAQTLAQARDSQRLSDLATLKSAISLYMTTVSPVDLEAGIAATCLGDTNVNALISYSAVSAEVVCAAVLVEGTGAEAASDYHATDFCRSLAADGALTDGTGWIPVNFNNITGGSPLSNLPLDPTNADGDGSVFDTTPTSADYYYRYMCQQGVADAGDPTPAFEIDAVLESVKYKTTDDLDAKDGGDNAAYYEVGTAVSIGPTSADF